MMQHDNNKLPPELVMYDEHETAAIVGKKVATLRADRIKGGGIPFCKMGRTVRYRLSDIQAYIEANMRTSTSQE